MQRRILIAEDNLEISQLCGIFWYGLNRLPSISRYSGRTDNCSMARCIARKDAFRIFILSISSGDTQPTAQAIASFSIKGRSSYRCFSVSFFESFNVSHVKSDGKMTAAAYTAPARQPRPASSHPASTTFLFLF